MSKQSDAQQPKQKQITNLPHSVAERADKQLGVADQPNGLLSLAHDGSTRSQVTLLGDARLHEIQRHAVATRIGRLHGNAYLQRALARVAAVTASAQRAGESSRASASGTTAATSTPAREGSPSVWMESFLGELLPLIEAGEAEGIRSVLDEIMNTDELPDQEKDTLRRLALTALEIDAARNAGQLNKITRAMQDVLSGNVRGKGAAAIQAQAAAAIEEAASQKIAASRAANNATEILRALEPAHQGFVPEDVKSRLQAQADAALNEVLPQQMEQATASGDPTKILKALEAAYMGLPSEEVAAHMQAQADVAFKEIFPRRLQEAIATGDPRKVLKAMEPAYFGLLPDDLSDKMQADGFAALTGIFQGRLPAAIEGRDVMGILKVIEAIQLGLVQDEAADKLMREAVDGLRDLGRADLADMFEGQAAVEKESPIPEKKERGAGAVTPTQPEKQLPKPETEQRRLPTKVIEEEERPELEQPRVYIKKDRRYGRAILFVNDLPVLAVQFPMQSRSFKVAEKERTEWDFGKMPVGKRVFWDPGTRRLAIEIRVPAKVEEWRLNTGRLEELKEVTRKLMIRVVRRGKAPYVHVIELGGETGRR